MSELKIATWNVNGIRAREGQLTEWLASERPDVVCIQEIKAAPEQIPACFVEPQGYWCRWHGQKGYSGVGLLLSRERFAEPPVFTHPEFDHESRIVTTSTPAVPGGKPLLLVSVYVPNGGKDYDAKLHFLERMEAWVGQVHAAGTELVLCGDLNVARTDQDVHPKERKATAIGQRPDERAIFERLLGRGLVDVGRTFDPANDALYTWWPPWRDMRKRNIGWRIDYILASEGFAKRAARGYVQPNVGTSDHAPVLAVFDGTPV